VSCIPLQLGNAPLGLHSQLIYILQQDEGTNGRRRRRHIVVVVVVVVVKERGGSVRLSILKCPPSSLSLLTSSCGPRMVIPNWR